MSDAPERIWLPPEQAEDAALSDNGYGLAEYVRADTIAALTARLAEVEETSARYAAAQERHLVLGAGVRQRAEAAEAALATARANAREAMTVCNRNYGGNIADVYAAIAALIDKDAAIPAHRRSPMEHERDAK